MLTCTGQFFAELHTILNAATEKQKTSVFLTQKPRTPPLPLPHPPVLSPMQPRYRPDTMLTPSS